MAENTIDTLELQIQSNANQAEKSLNSLVTTLGKVNKTLHGVNSGGIGAVASNVNKLSTALNSLSGLDISLPKGFAKEINGLSKIDFSAFKDMDNVSKHLRELASGIQAFDGLQDVKIPKLESKNIRSISRAINSFEDVDVTKIQPVTDGITKISHAMSVLNTVDLKDSKITNVLGSIKRLTQADMSNFDVGKITEIANSISSFSNIPEISSNVNRFVSSFARLANAGEKTGQTASSFDNLGRQVKKTITNLSGVGEISEPLNLFVQSIGRLASAGNKTGQTAEGMEKLSEETMKFFNVMKNAPKISQNTIDMTQALAQLAAAGGNVNRATNTISQSFSKLSLAVKSAKSVLNGIEKAVGFAARNIVKLGSKISSAFKNITASSHGLKTASFNLGTLLKTAIGFRSIQGIFNLGRSALDGKGILEIGSDVAEVQNVVDVAFGDMSGMVDEFAKTSAEKFGLSELAAKQYSGTMMAMLKSSGVAKQSAAEMSTTLAGLAGNIASFYNIDADEAFGKIRSGIAGEIEPLRQLGISMTVANLEAYALSQGITKSYQSMTQAEQAMLRYNYLMWASADAQGDFARTSDSYANQIRMLKLNIQQLSATIGQGIIAAILPAIQALNKLMSVLIKAANAFKVFMYTLMGKKIKNSAGGIVQDVSGLGNAGNDAAGGLGNAADAAGELKKKLSVLPFDQLNQLTDNSDKSGSGGGTGGGAGGGIGGGDFDTGLDDILSEDKEGPINEWAKRIREAFLAEDWEKLGFEIADGLNRGLQKVYDVISWENVGPKITAFTSAFTETFNSFVKNFDWDLLGRVIGTGINTAVNTFNQLVGPNGIDFVSLGGKLSEGFRGLVNEINWENLGHALGNGFMVSWNMTKGFIDNMWATSNLTGMNGWQELGISLAKGTKSLFESIDFASIGSTLANAFNGVFETLKAYVAQMTSDGTWNEIATNIYTGLNNMIHGIDWASAGKTLSGFVVNLLGVFKKVAQETDWEGFGRGIGEFLSNIDWFTIIGQVGTIILEAFSGMLVGLFDSSSGKVTLIFLGALLGIKGIFGLVNLGEAVQEWLTGSQEGFFGLINFIKGDAKKGISEGVEGIAGKSGLFSKLATGASSVVSEITPILGSIGSVIFSTKGLLIAGIVAGVAAIILNWDKIKEAAGKVKDWVSQKWQEVKQATSQIWGNVSNFLSETWNNLKTWSSEKFNNIKENISTAWSNIEQKTSDIWGNVKDFTKNTWDNLKTSASGIFGNIKESVSQAWSNVKGTTSSVWSNIETTVSGIWSGLNKDASTSFSNIDKTVSSSSSSSNKNVIREWDSIRKSMNNVMRGMDSDMSRATQNIARKFSNLSSEISNSIGNLYQVGRNAAQSFSNGFQSVYIPTPHIYTYSYTRHRVGDTTFSTPNFDVEWYKTGGLFSKASVIGVGEAGKEAVLPLENKRTMSMIADSIVKSSSGMGVNEEALTNAVARGVAMAMTGSQSPVNVTCYAELRTEDNEVLARAVTKGQRSIDSRMNPTLQFSY